MTNPLSFSDLVVLVTGAGGGLGRQYALAFARRGASVVVNDLGGDIKGGGKSSRAADLVVEEIKKLGGKAVANYDSVENGESLVKTAIDAFGKIDILINNAGILRDRSFARMTTDDWDIIHRVHLRGSFLVTKAAWPYMRNQKFGRIIMTSSGAGVYGNFGQANYSAAKLGLLGLSNTLAIEGEKYNIHCNTIVPVAGSRLTETALPPDLVEALKPEYVSPLVLYLCHDSCNENGGVFEIAAGWLGRIRWQQSNGAVIRKKNEAMTPEAVRDNWDQICDFSDGGNNFTKIQDSTGKLISVLAEIENAADADIPVIESDAPLDKKLMSVKLNDVKYNVTAKDVILYALGVGISLKSESDLKFVYEGAEGFTPLPTFPVIPAQSAGLTGFFEIMPKYNLDLSKLLHGEQYLELFKPCPTSGVLTNRSKIVDVLDKGSGALILMNVETFDEADELVARNQFTLFFVGAGKFGGKRTSDHAIPLQEAPKRNPDASMTTKTATDQAALYRLSGDVNPLHIDPNFAAMGGFESPILHGLCSFGISVSHVMKQYGGNNPSNVKAVKVRFTKPVLPGQSIQTDMWQEGSRIHFQSKVVENGNVVLSGAYVDLKSVEVAEKVQETPKADGLMCDQIFEEMKKRLKDTPGVVKSVKAIFLWQITKDGKVVSTWTMDLKNGDGDIYKGEPKSGKAGCTLILSDDDLFSLVTGKLNPQKAFMQGKLKLKGNIMLSQKLTVLFKQHSKL